MDLSLNIAQLVSYTSQQLNNFFPDKEDLLISEQTVSGALKRLDFCFSHVTLGHYFDGKSTRFNHLHSDQYVMYLWFLANEIYIHNSKNPTSSKLYYLNKSLNGIDCMYDTQMPNVFLIFHGVGTMLGKAKYDEYFIVLQGCTVGSQKGKYPTIGKGVSLTANSSIIGDCIIGNRVTISSRSIIFGSDIEDDNTAFIDYGSGQLKMKATKQCYAQQFFNIDLKKI